MLFSSLVHFLVSDFQVLGNVFRLVQLCFVLENAKLYERTLVKF